MPDRAGTSWISGLDATDIFPVLVTLFLWGDVGGVSFPSFWQEGVPFFRGTPGQVLDAFQNGHMYSLVEYPNLPPTPHISPPIFQVCVFCPEQEVPELTNPNKICLFLLYYLEFLSLIPLSPDPGNSEPVSEVRAILSRGSAGTLVLSPLPWVPGFSPQEYGLGHMPGALRSPLVSVVSLTLLTRPAL